MGDRSLSRTGALRLTLCRQMQLGRLGEATEWLQQALFAWQQLNRPERIVACLETLGSVYFHQQLFQQAMSHYQVAVQVGEEHRLVDAPNDRLEYRMQQTWDALAVARQLQEERDQSQRRPRSDLNEETTDLQAVPLPQTQSSLLDESTVIAPPGSGADSSLLQPPPPRSEGVRPSSTALQLMQEPISARLMRSQLLRQRNRHTGSKACTIM